MKMPAGLRAVAALVPLLLLAREASGAVSATASLFSISSPEKGSCALKGFDTSSNNYLISASVSAKDATMIDGCARCIKVTKDSVSVVAYVLDVCNGCPAGQLRLSPKALEALKIDQTANNVAVSYKTVTCPSTMLSGNNVKACLMEGAGNWYIPLQFYNSLKIVSKATIMGAEAEQKKDSFYFSATPKDGNALGEEWYKNVPVTLTAKDGESQSGTFSFAGKSGCAQTTFQFQVANTGDAEDDLGGSSSTKKSSIVLPVLLGAVGAIVVVVGSLFFIRRRRNRGPTDMNHDMENLYMSPKPKMPPAETLFPVEPLFPTASCGRDESQSHNTHPGSDMSSPRMDYNPAYTPAAPRSVDSAGSSKSSSAPPLREVGPTAEQPAYAQAPKISVVPTYTFSKPPSSVDRQSQPMSNHSSWQHEGPTVPAPVLPPALVARSNTSSDQGSDRSSFDIDDLRNTHEEQKRAQPTYDDDNSAYPSDPNYATTAMTSPQSYVRATTLRRPNSRPPSQRDTSRFTSLQAAGLSPRANSSSDSQRDSYASENTAAYPPSGTGAAAGGGYSRDSLGILGYPYARKPSSRSSNNITEMQF